MSKALIHIMDGDVILVTSDQSDLEIFVVDQRTDEPQEMGDMITVYQKYRTHRNFSDIYKDFHIATGPNQMVAMQNIYLELLELEK